MTMVVQLRLKVPRFPIKGEYQFSFVNKKSGSFCVKRLKIALKYGDVETHGYF